jgi:hypothetical protein
MQTPAELREKAARYRAMATVIIDQRTVDALQSLAAEYEALADQIERDAAQGDSGPD